MSETLAFAIVIIGCPSVIPSETTLETLGDRTWYCWCQTVNQVTRCRRGHGSFFFLFIATAVSNSRGGLSFVELRRKRGVHPSTLQTWGAALGRFEDRVTGCIVYSPRLMKATNCSLRARLPRLAADRCAFALANEAKFVVPFLKKNTHISYAASEASCGNINASSLNLIFCTFSVLMLLCNYDETVDVILKKIN